VKVNTVFNRDSRAIDIAPRRTAPRRSWWVGLGRERFNEQAAIELERMRTERLPRAVESFFSAADYTAEREAKQGRKAHTGAGGDER
jgi:hypothetical protein